MKVLVALSVLGFGFCAWAAHQGVATYDKEYSDADGNSLKALAVCSVSPEAVACWGMDGQPNVEQSKRTEAALLDQNVNISFVYLRKNRYVVLSQSQGSNIGFNFNRSGGQMIYQKYMEGTPPQSIILEALALDNDAKTIEVPFSVTKKQAGELVLPLAKNASGTLGAQTIGFDSSMMNPIAGPFATSRDVATSRDWALIFNIGNRAKGVAFQATVLDKDRKPIQFVDQKGNPVDQQTYQKEMDDMAQRRGEGAKYAPVRTWNTRIGDDSIRVNTTVNPERVAFVRFTENQRIDALLTGIPADPVP